MPAIPPGSLVLVTGASGFIATHAVKSFLDAGFPVRGTVRSKEKGDYLVNLFKNSKVPFTYVIVKDIAEPDAFDEAVKDVVGVAHLASPFHLKADDPKELIVPAVNGTVGVLKSVKKINPNVKRVVITSSVASIVDESKKAPHRYTDDDWNNYSPGVVEAKGRDAPNGDKYRASKTLAERAFWKFIEEEKPSFDGATVNPPMVYGPILQPINKIEEVNTSVANVLDWFVNEKKPSDIPSVAPFNWVDVRNVADAHVRALVVPEAGGNRFIVGNGPGSPNDFLLTFERHYPERSHLKGDASKVESINAGSNVMDGSKATRVLGIQYIDFDTSVKDTVDSLIAKFGV